MRRVSKNLMLLFLIACLMSTALLQQPAFAQSYKVGDLIEFGKAYGEPILWRIIHIDNDGNALLFSERIISFLPYNFSKKTSDWEYSSARSYLNSQSEIGFLNNQNFTNAEKDAIVSSKIKVVSNELITDKEIKGTEIFNSSNTKPYSYTFAIDNYISDEYYKHYEVTDKVFLLSIGELKNYVLANNFNIMKMPSKGAVDNIWDEYSIRKLFQEGDYLPEDPKEHSGYFLRGAFHGDSRYEDESVPYIPDSYNEYPGDIWPETATYENFYHNRGIGFAPALYLDMSKSSVYRVVSNSTSTTSIAPIINSTAPTNYKYPFYSFDINSLNTVIDEKSARAWIKDQLSQVTPEMKKNPNWIEQFQLFIESGLYKSYPINYPVSNNGSIAISQDFLNNKYLEEFKTEFEQELSNFGITLPRPLNFGQNIVIPDLESFSILVYPKTEMIEDYIVISNKSIKIKLTKSFLGSLKEITNITVSKINNSYNAYEIVSDKLLNENLNVALLPQTSNYMYQVALLNESIANGGKYNPGDGFVWFRVKENGKYSIVERFRTFLDISTTSEQVQHAIHVLASKGIINGTSNTEFSPNKSINRAEIAALILKAISKLDNTAPMPFKDVTSKDWYYNVSASAKKHGIMSGISADQFAPMLVIPKDQIIVVVARTLRMEMAYLNPGNINEVLNAYTDHQSIQSWAKNDIAYARVYDLDILSKDNKFAPKNEMTRGDAALILYNLFSKIWN